jgi:hypothetical protein
MSSNDLFPRFEKAAELLAVKSDSLIKTFNENGITNDSTGIFVLESKTTTIEDIVGIIDGLKEKIPVLKKKAAAGILKGESNKKEIPVNNLSIAEELKMARPVEQWSDEDLLRKYIDKREYEVEQELHKRAKQQRFVVLVPSEKGYSPGNETIDLKKSLELLKNARKRTNPSMIPVEGGVRPVYFVTELNILDRMTELCPLCEKALYDNYCDSCQVNFLGIDDDSRAFINLVSKMDNFSNSSMSDRKALVASSMKGSLKSDWPSLSQYFDEMKILGTLPKLRIIATRPAKKVADPYFQDGNRSVGNKKF